MTPNIRKFTLTAHVASSVAWIGAVASFLVLSITGLTSKDAQVIRAAYLSMNLIGQWVIVPLSFLALTSGLVQSVGTEWGLFRHYWVLTKFVLTIGATFLLLLHQFTAVSGAARHVSMTAAETVPDVGVFGTQLVGDSVLAIVVLLTTTVLSVYKPWGRTRYARRQQQALTPSAPGNEITAESMPFGLKALLAMIGLIGVGFVLTHLIGGGFRMHAH